MEAVAYSDPIAYYDRNAEVLTERYESVSFEDVHGDLIPWLPKPGSRVLDVGAGSGRDAAWLVKHGYIVTAVEPSAGLRKEGLRLHKHRNLTWVDDALPDLARVIQLDDKYDLILMSAVLMFLPPAIQPNSLLTLATLLAPTGKLALTVRFGPAEPERGLYEADETRLRELIRNAGLSKFLSFHASEDRLGRPDVRWVSVIVQQF